MERFPTGGWTHKEPTKREVKYYLVVVFGFSIGNERKLSDESLSSFTAHELEGRRNPKKLIKSYLPNQPKKTQDDPGAPKTEDLDTD